jgi:perosamine synthetase
MSTTSEGRPQPAAFTSVLRRVLGEASSPISLHEPEFRGNEWAYVKECIDTGWVSSVGKYVDEFERQIASVTGARHAVAVVNGTAALHVALTLVGVRHGEEVIVPSLSFVATANAVSHCGAFPHFVDSSAATLGLDPQALDAHLDRIAEKLPGGGVRNRETGRRIAAIIPMHTFGFPVDMESLLEVAGRWGLPVVEDAAESLGSSYHGQAMGTFGKVGTLSFNGNKIVTTGGGGAIVTNDPALARLAKELTTTAKRPHKWEFFHEMVAFNYRLPNLNAALGCAQLERLPDFLARKRRLAMAYRDAFAGMPGVQFVDEQPGSIGNFWLVAIRLPGVTLPERDALLAAANEAGYHCRPVWTLLHRLPMYAQCPRAGLPVAEALEATLINVPSSPALAERLA